MNIALNKIPSSLTEISDEEIKINDFGISMSTIGSQDSGYGNDEFILLQRKTGDVLTPEFAERWMLARFYCEIRRPGRYFCHVVRAEQVQHKANECVCVIEHRYDV